MESAEALNDLIGKETVEAQAPFCLEEGTAKLEETTEEKDGKAPSKESGGGDILSLYVEQLRATTVQVVNSKIFNVDYKIDNLEEFLS